MIEFLQTVLALIVTISILVTIHEYGHYFVARLCNVHVIRFSVGFGTPLIVRRGKAPELSSAIQLDINGQPVPVRTRSNEPLQGTEFAVAAIPLGGYVKMLDEREGFVADDQLHLAFNRKSVWQRMAIVSAGPAANFLLAIVVYWILFATGVTGVAPILGKIDADSPAGRAGLSEGQEIVAVDGLPVKTWSDVNLSLFDHLGDTGEIAITAIAKGRYEATNDYVIPVTDWLSNHDSPVPTRELGLTLRSPFIPPVIGGIVADGRAKVAGIIVGDEILATNERQVGTWQEWVEVIQAHPEQTLTVSLLRAGTQIELQITPAALGRDGKTIGFIGASVEPVPFPEEMLRTTTYPIYSAWLPAVRKTWEVTAFTLTSIQKMLVGAISPKNLSGPITIAQVANATAENGFESFIGFIALLSISLGVLNLLPIPVLDGGHLMYYIIELIAGRPVPEKVQMLGLQVGMFFIMSIMMFAIYNDLTRL